MDAIIERCCGLDVHQASVVACLLVGTAGTKPRREIRKFGTYTQNLAELREWLEAQGCTHVAMESTGVFWRPVYAMLEGAFEVVVGNAFHMRNVPGRKTDVKDAEWIADLLRHGLIAKSFVPPKAIRELRDLTRYRRRLVETRATERNRLLKQLELANIKLSSVATDVFGVSGMAMLEALARGETDADALAGLAQGRMKSKRLDLARALAGALSLQQQFMLRLSLRRLKAIETDLAAIDRQAAKSLRPHRQQLAALQAIPGIGPSIAPIVVAELGVDASAFPSARQLAAWTGLCPGNNESAGKNLGARTRKGNPVLRTALVEAARAAVRTRNSYLRAKYHRLKARRGGKRALVAIAHKILIAIYHVHFGGRPYVDLGDTYLDRLNGDRAQRSLVKRLERMGFQVSLSPREPAAIEEVPANPQAASFS